MSLANLFITDIFGYFNTLIILISVVAVVIFIIVIIIVYKLMHSNVNQVRIKQKSITSDNPYIKRDLDEKKEEAIPQKSIFCSYCGAELKKISKYCPLCGAKMS